MEDGMDVTQAQEYVNDVKATPPNNMATASMVLGIIGIVTVCCCGGFIFGSLGIGFALLSKVDSTFEKRGKIGLITGIIGLVLSVILIIILIVVGIAESASTINMYSVSACVTSLSGLLGGMI